MESIGFLHLLYLGVCRGATPLANCSLEETKNRDVNALFVKIYVYCFSNMVHSRIHLSKVGLSYDTNELVLKDAFGQHGEIIEVKVICDHKSGKSKGYGFVHFMSEDSASKALVEMNGQLLDSRNIRIQYANKK